MAKIKRVSPRKEPLQRRSIELRNAVLQAATYVLKKEGPDGFTTNKVADRAGVNIASLYQYYPNKESLLFHMVEIEWTATFNSIFPILIDSTRSHRERLHRFIERFYETEAEEAQLRQAISAAGFAIESTKEYKQLAAKADEAFMDFLSEALEFKSKDGLRKTGDFIFQVISSFSDGISAGEWEDPKGDAQMMSKMLCDYFHIGV